MPACPACGLPAASDKPFCADCGAELNLTSARTRARRPDLEPAEERQERGPSGRTRFIPGTRIAGRYRIVGRLGQGGMGVVYRAEDLKLGQTVALKFLPSRLEEDSTRLDQLLNEVRLARQVSHPNVCRVYDAGEVDGRHFLSMEYVDGENLASLLRRIGRLPRDKAIELARQLCAGLHAAHDQGILHRDLKPANIMIDGRGRARITDFGLAVLGESLESEEIGSGTPAYMAPEHLKGESVTVQSDIYSLGLVLYELFTGKVVFPSTGRQENLRLRLESTPSSPSDHVDGFDPAVERVILRCLEPDPANRPRSAMELFSALPGGDPLAAALAAGDTPSPEMVAAAGESEAMQPARALALAVAVVAASVLMMTLLGRSSLRAYLPELKPPEVMVDRAREIITELGYTEPAYADPEDSVFWYTSYSNALDAIRESDTSAERWERLRDPDAGVLFFWYRQSPRALKPRRDTDGPIKGLFSSWNPFPRTTGEMEIELDVTGRLETFIAMPRRFSRQTTPVTEFDWSRAFALAGLDPADYQRTEPRYQRFMHLDQRAAWLPRAPEGSPRIEAGASEGRLALFVKLGEGSAERLAAEPEVMSEERIDFVAWLFSVSLVISAFMARFNDRRGRTDRQAALRFGLLFGGLGVLKSLLRDHELLPDGALGEAALTGLMAAVLYMALEPHARAIWPSMLASWSRLVGRAGGRWRDPAVGRAVLAGMAAGLALGLVRIMSSLAAHAWEGAPPPPESGWWLSLGGLGAASGVLVTTTQWGLFESVFATFQLVLARKILKRRAPAVIGAGLIWIAPDLLQIFSSSGQMHQADLIRSFCFLIPAVCLLYAVLLRWGLLASIAMNATGYSLYASGVSDWGAWHAQPGILGLVFISLLALYGYRAATAGRPLLGEARGQGAAAG